MATGEAPGCEDFAAAMVEQCADEYDALARCLAAASAEACDAANLAHGRCLHDAEASRGEPTVEEHDAAFARYLCEVAQEPADDCDARIAACA
ncbi:MAG: hypothetical protein U0168_12280 [Nannocystaceae bacterium]